MARVNLNLPAEDRARLRRLAQHAKLREAEYARDLLVRALAVEERLRLSEAIRASRTPARVARERQVLSGLEQLRGPR